MADSYYIPVVWTSGDILTEAKLDNMVANDRAVDAMDNGIEMLERANPSTPGSNKLHLYTKDKDGIPTLYIINDAGTIYEISEGRPSFLATISGGLIVGDSQTPIIPVHRPLIIIKAYAFVKTAPTGASIIIDINKNGGSIWVSTPANRLTILAGDSSGVQTAFDTITLAEADSLTFDIDQIGSSVSGNDLSILLRCK